MESAIRVCEDAAGPYHPLRAIDGVSDDSRLHQLGYKQELSRSLSAIANFSVTFSIVSVITGITTLFGTGLTYGGPVTMVYGWLIVGLLTLPVVLSMAEICSAYPTAGGLYFWSAKLCGNDWGPLASWLTGCATCRSANNFAVRNVAVPNIAGVEISKVQELIYFKEAITINRRDYVFNNSAH